MCILFFHSKKVAQTGKFRLILVSNRDEKINRPAKSAHFWEENHDVFGGQDLQDGDVGGAWLAMNKNGRSATLLNLSSPSQQSGARSRGHLVKEFVTSDLSAREYLRQLAERASSFNPFHLLTFQVLPDSVQVWYLARPVQGNVKDPEDISPSATHDLSMALSNSPLAHPYLKASQGCARFQRILEEKDNTSDKEGLLSSLLDLAKTETSFFPDPVLAENRDPNFPHLKSLSSIFVHIPEIGYGTRTHTVILVDDAGQVDILESTLRPGGEVKVPSDWLETRVTFTLHQKTTDSD